MDVCMYVFIHEEEGNNVNFREYSSSYNTILFQHFIGPCLICLLIWFLSLFNRIILEWFNYKYFFIKKVKNKNILNNNIIYIL